MWQLARLAVHLFYYLLIELIRYVKGPIRKISVKARRFHEALVAQEWEWKAEQRKENETVQFEFSQCNGESLLISISTYSTHSECFVSVVHNGVTYQSDVHESDNSCDERIFSCGPLLLEVRSPFRRWRICFRGEMCDPSGVSHFVSICGWFKPTSDASYFFENVQLSSFSEHFLKIWFSASENMRLFESIRRREDTVQWGEMHVEIRLAGNTECRRYRGIKRKSENRDTQSENSFSVYFEDGNRIFWHSETSADYGNALSHAVRTASSGQVIQLRAPIKGTGWGPSDLGVLSFCGENNELFTVRKTNDFSSSVEFVSNGNVQVTRVYVEHESNRGIAFIVHRKAALTEEKKTSRRHRAVPPTSLSPLCSSTHSLVLPFSHSSCQDPSRTGGKGANLARLVSLQQEFFVPRGVVITTHAYNEHVKTNPDIGKLIAKLEKADTLEQCILLGGQLADLFKASTVSGELQKILEESVDFECGESSLAIRSHAQSLTPPMAVVVQSMVPDGIAGVLFTCDPVTRNPSHMVINAINGIGEDIVSGAVTPDTVVITKRGAVIEQPEHCCLDVKILLKLCKIGNYLEEVFHRPQDIEFVVRGEQVFLFQCRPITGLDSENEFELLTEFDSGTLTDKEIMTTANVGEVFSKTQTPLTYSCNYILYEKALTRQVLRMLAKKLPRHREVVLGLARQKVFFNMGEMFLRQWRKCDPISEYAVAGEKLLTAEMWSMGKRRFPQISPWAPLYRLGFMTLGMLWGSQSAYKRVEILCEKIEKLTAREEEGMESLLETCQAQRELQAQLIADHGFVTACSSFTYVIVAMLIRGSGGGDKDLTPEMLSDIAKVFSNSTSHVISADVPGSLKRIARAISNGELLHEFELLEGELAMNLIRENREIGSMIEDFFTKHGHRGENELDLCATSWSERPDMLISTLKLMVKDISVNEESEVMDVNSVEVVDQLKNKPKGIARWLMRYMIGQTHKGVGRRELAKNLLVKGNAAIRSTVRKIGEKLAKEGFIPSSELVFFFTLEEIEELSRTRSAKLVSRANRRLQTYEKQCGLQYQHVYWGPVEPIDSYNHSTLRTLVQLNGTPVCEGRVIGRARVAKTLDEARSVQPGEILITRFTDICWSPFFPIIKGIVTEIGGLLSHGAVVAREYGVPSLIAVTHATDVFETGDLVELDATTKGTISKIAAN